MRRSLVAVAVLGLVATASFGSTTTAGQEATPADCPTSSEAENIATARIWHEEAINNRNLDALQDVLAADVVHHAAGGYPDVTDAAGVVAMMSEFPPAFSDLHYTIDFFVTQDDMVVERYTATGTQDGPLGSLPPTGHKATWTGINIFRFECGKIAEVWSEVDALRRLEQLAGGAEATPEP